MTSTRILARRLSPLLPLAIAPSLWAQGVFLNGSGYYTQSFDTLPTAAGTSWVNDSTIPGWLAFTDATPNPFPIGVYDGGAAATNGLLSMGLAGSSDRALGYRPTTTNYGMTLLGFVLRNTSSSPMTIGRVEFTGELWRTHDTANNVDGYQVFYQVGTGMPSNLGPFTVNNGATYAANAAVDDPNWTRIPELEYSQADAAAATPLVPQLSRVIALNFMGLTLQAGQYLTFRWRNPNDTGGDAVMGIDDFSFSYTVPGASLVYNPAHGVGAGPDGVLAPSAAQYWTKGAAPSGFAQGDHVTFNADATASIAVPANALVSSMTVSAQAGVYSIGGPGRIEGALVKSGAGGLVLTSANGFSSVTLHDGGTISAPGAGALNANTIAMTNGGTLDVGADSTVFRAVTGTGPLVKAGAGILRLGGGAIANTYSGLTTVSGGTLEAAKNAGTLAIPGNLVIEAGAAFRYGGDNRGHQIADSATVTINGGSFGDPALAAPVNPGAPETVLSVVINGGTFSTGRAVFVANSEFTLNSGTAWVARGGSLVAGNRVTVGGTMNLDGGSTTAGQESRLVIGGGGLTLNDGTIQMNTGPSTLAAGSTGSIITVGGNITSTGTSAITRFNAATVAKAEMNFQGFDRALNVTGSLTIGSAAAPVAVMNGGIVKSGPGVLLLGGAQTYLQATTVNGGKLLIDGSLASTVVTVGAAGTFGGSGTLTGALQVSNGGTIEAGLGSAGALTLASLRLGATTGDQSSLSIPIQATPALVVTNANGLVANGGAASVTISVRGAVPAAAQHPIIDYEGVIGGAGFGAFVLGALPNRVEAELINDPGGTAILLDVTSVDQPVWTGAASSEWSTAALGSPKNWVLQSDAVTGTDFLQNDYVVFADAVNPVVDISVEDVAPAMTRFANVNAPYLITGSKGIAGAGEFVLEGAGGVTIENVNSFTGPVVLKAGVLSVASLTDSGVAGPLGAGGSIVLDGGVLEISGLATSTNRGFFAATGGGSLVTAGEVILTGSLSGTGVVAKNGPGKLVLAGSNDGFNGRLAIAGGSVRFSGGSIGGNSVTIALDGGELEHADLVETVFNDGGAILRALELGVSGGTLRVANASGAMSFQRFGGVSGFGIVNKTGPGTLRMQASNPGLAANWMLEEGVLEAGATDALGNGNVTVNGGMLATRNTLVTTPVTMTGGALGTRTGDLGDFGGPVAVDGPIDVFLRSYTTPAQSRSLTISGPLSGAADIRVDGNLPESGAALILTNATNSYSGTFRVAPGQFLTSRPLSPGNPFGTAAIVLTDAALHFSDDGFGDDGLIYYPNAVTVTGASASRIEVGRAGGVSVGNTIELGSLSIGAQKLIVSGVNQHRLGVTGVTTLTAPAIFEPATADLVLHGEIAGGFGFTKTGAGRLIVDGFASFTGTMNVQAGTLVFNGVTGDSVDAQVSGGVFAGAGILGGDLVFQGPSTFAPGDGLRGVLQVDQALVLDAATVVQFDLGRSGGVSPLPGDDYAQVRVGPGDTGTVALNNAVLSLTISGNLQEDDLFFLFLNDGADAVEGQFAGLGQGATFVSGGQLFQISYTADDAGQALTGGNDIALRAIPEPGSLLLVAGGLLLCGFSRRRAGARE